MSRTHYQMYQEQTFVLAKTLIVKHEEIASSMNTDLYYQGYEIDSNPYNWRYYLNLSGEYHQADKDALYDLYGTEYIMVKLPSDVGPMEVPLTTDLLHGSNADKSMINEYQIGSKFYTELVSRYPDFETLIIGILNPIDRGVAIRAYNGEILFIAGRYKKIESGRNWFDSTWYSANEVLIEPQEDNLIFELQRYIDTFLRHWNNPEYIEGNDLYVVTMVGILYCNIPNVIANIRLGNCKTPRAHTFHIRQYLESHGQIGRYVDFIPIASSVWLYRNIEYLEANTGKQLTFDSILDNLLTPNAIPMSAYSIRHELSNMNDDKLLPTGMLYKEVLNFEIIGASDNDRTVLDILEDQRGVARDNHKDHDIKERDIQDTINWGGDDRLNTKVLESEMMELGEPYPFTQSQFLFNLWGYTAIKGYYVGTAFATNPLTGDRLSFSSKNAYILALYCLNKSMAGVELEYIPKVRLYQIPRTNQKQDLPSDKTYTLKPDTNKLMSWCNNEKTRRLKVLEVVGTHQPEFYAQDSEEFYNNVRDIYDERVRKYNTYCDVEELEERGDLELIAKRLYWVGFEETILDMSYEDWFRTVGFDPTSFDDNDLMILGLELVASATGIQDQDTARKKWLQKSLLAIMEHFISYTVHVIEKYADGAVAYLEGQTLRFSDIKWSYTGSIPVKYNIPLDYDVTTLVKQKMHVDISNVFENAKVDIKARVDTGFDLSNFGLHQTRHTMNVGTYALGAQILNLEFNVEEAIPFYIVVIDNVIDSYMIGRVSGRTRESSLTYAQVSDTSLSLMNIQTNRLDNFITTHVRDAVEYGTTIEGMYVDITDDDYNDQNRVDTVGVSAIGLSGGIRDGDVTPIHVIDSMHVVDSLIKGVITDEVTELDKTTADLEAMTIVGMTAGVKDGAFALIHSDDSMIRLDDMTMSLVDPQIPEVTTNTDIISLDIANVSGRTQDSDVTHINHNNNGMVLYNVGVTIVEPIDSYDRYIDIDGVAIGDILGRISDSNSVVNYLDTGSAINIGEISISQTDTDSGINITQTDGVTIANITGAVKDLPSVQGTSNDNITIDNISGTITDAEFEPCSVSDDTSILTSNITMNYVDQIPNATGGDVNNISVTNITLSVIDDFESVELTELDNAILLANVGVRVSDNYDTTGMIDTSQLAITNITGRIESAVEEIHHIDHDSTVVMSTLIAVSLNDIEVDLNLQDGITASVDSTELKARTTDTVVTSDLSNDASAVIGGMNIQINITDESDDSDSQP